MLRKNHLVRYLAEITTKSKKTKKKQDNRQRQIFQISNLRVQIYL